jgi:hypothetical protein
MKLLIVLTEKEKRQGIEDFGCDVVIATKLSKLFGDETYDSIYDVVSRNCARDQSVVEIEL